MLGPGAWVQTSFNSLVTEVREMINNWLTSLPINYEWFFLKEHVCMQGSNQTFRCKCFETVMYKPFALCKIECDLCLYQWLSVKSSFVSSAPHPPFIITPLLRCYSFWLAVLLVPSLPLGHVAWYTLEWKAFRVYPFFRC